MTFSLAPLAAGAAGKAATAGALALSAATPIVQGLQQRAAAKSQAEQAGINSFIGQTRALQTDTSARRGLNDELSTLRNALGANSDRPSVGTFDIMQELRETRDRSRRIDVGNRMQEARTFGRQQRSFDRQARFSLLRGSIDAAPSLFDLYNFTRAQGG